MTIAIIGAGFTGLSAAYKLATAGHGVTVFEKDSKPGGLAVGFKKPEWDWPLEQHYHHWFTSDHTVLEFVHNLNYPVIIKRPKTSVYLNGSVKQLDSPYHVLTFPDLPLLDRIRMAGSIAFLKYNPVWKPLEKYRTSDYLIKSMGEKAYTLLWKPQLYNKFGSYADTISLAWFWARINKRTSSLAYPKKGYLSLAQTLTEKIEKQKGTIVFNATTVNIKAIQAKVHVSYKINSSKEKIEQFDDVLVTTASYQFSKMAPQLPPDYIKMLNRLKGLGAINLVLRLKKQFLDDGTYWLSICDTQSPVMAVVEHTNFMDKKYYNNEHIVYLGNYAPTEDRLFHLTKKELFDLYHPFLARLHAGYTKQVIGYEVFKAPFAQPIIPVSYSKRILPIKTPLPHVYLSNMQQVYPWDRGTNYAVELGFKAADVIMSRN